MTVPIKSMKFVEKALGMLKDLILLAMLETDHQKGKPRPDKLKEFTCSSQKLII